MFGLKYDFEATVMPPIAQPMEHWTGAPIRSRTGTYRFMARPANHYTKHVLHQSTGVPLGGRTPRSWQFSPALLAIRCISILLC